VKPPKLTRYERTKRVREKKKARLAFAAELTRIVPTSVFQLGAMPWILSTTPSSASPARSQA
jgi:hypothetical protein